MPSVARTTNLRGSRFGALAVLAITIAAVTIWYSQVVSTAGVVFTCTTPAKSMTQAIDARMLDARTHVDRVRGVASPDSRYEQLFFTSANVRVDGVFVGTGTWASNVTDFGPGDFRGWAATPKYYSLWPVNDLARAISSDGGFGLENPGMTAPAKYSQRCVVGSNDARK